jgi:hypothetical protein
VKLCRGLRLGVSGRVSRNAFVEGPGLVLVDMPEVPGVALGRALDVGLRGKPTCGGATKEALGKLSGPGEVWVLTKEPSRRLGSVGGGSIGIGVEWPSSPSLATNGLLSRLNNGLSSRLNLKLA